MRRWVARAVMVGVGAVTVTSCNLTPANVESAPASSTTIPVTLAPPPSTTLAPRTTRASIVVGTVVLGPPCDPIAAVRATFDVSSAELKSFDRDQLGQIADSLIRARALGSPATVTIVGHTDSDPETTFPGGNDALSLARAQAVADALLATEVRGKRIERGWIADVRGVGTSDPLVSPETSPDDKARNRRVEVTFSCPGR